MAQMKWFRHSEGIHRKDHVAPDIRCVAQAVCSVCSLLTSLQWTKVAAIYQVLYGTSAKIVLHSFAGLAEPWCRPPSIYSKGFYDLISIQRARLHTWS